MNRKFDKTKETKNEAVKLLNENGKCLIVRPTGFGKSYILANIAPLYKRVIYFYPTEIISLDVQTKYQSILKKVDIDFVSYTYMTNIWKKGTIETDLVLQRVTNDSNTLFIFDEAHLTGGNKISQALDELLKTYPKAHLLGATATPNRSDYFNIRYHFFDGIEVSQYTMRDAIADKIFQKPYYVYSTFEIKENFKNLKREVRDSDMSDERKKKLFNIIKSSEMKYLNLYNEREVIRSNIEKANHDTDYLKFICFFPDKKTLYSKIDKIVNNFSEIYPTHRVKEIVVLSDTNKHRENVKKVQKLKRKEKCIDLIFCVDMINMGYHVNNIDGIIMYRNTYSDIIYSQQLGRCISIDSNIRPIIFDFVGNYMKHSDLLTNSVIANRKNNKNEEEINEFGKDDVEIIDNLREFIELERLIEAEKKVELEDAIIDAYLHKNAPIRYCLYELKLSNEKEFFKLMEMKKNGQSNIY